MFPLIETIIGFVAIMLVLSYLVKSLTSVIKNHFDFYSRNLRHEVYSLLEGTIDVSREALERKLADPKMKGKLPWLANDWKRLGETYLSKENITWVLKKMAPKKVTEDVIKDLDGRLKVHVENVRYMFEKRLKNVTLAVGVAFCLGFNINSVTILEKLYNDQDIRAKFSSADFVDSAINMQKQLETEIKDAREGQKKGELEKQREAVMKQIEQFRGEASFGIGKIWEESPHWKTFFFEFFGSLLTGVLISIGAPYWHELLRALTRLRKGKPETPP